MFLQKQNHFAKFIIDFVLQDVVTKTQKTLPKKQEAAASSVVKSGAAALWSGLANDWFS